MRSHTVLTVTVTQNEDKQGRTVPVPTCTVVLHWVKYVRVRTTARFQTTQYCTALFQKISTDANDLPLRKLEALRLTGKGVHLGQNGEKATERIVSLQHNKSHPTVPVAGRHPFSCIFVFRPLSSSKLGYHGVQPRDNDIRSAIARQV